MATRRFTHMADLGPLAQALRERSRLLAEARAAAAAQLLALERQRRYFADQVGPVTPLPLHDRAQHALPKPSPEPFQRQADERAALAEALSDEVDLESLLLTDDGLSFQRPGLASDVLARLRRGHWAIQGQLDLHGLRRDEARTAVAEFLREAHQRGWRCLRVVHGKGHGSPGREPVLKAKVQRWLAQYESVLAFTQATAPEGGSGALIVLLKG